MIYTYFVREIGTTTPIKIGRSIAPSWRLFGIRRELGKPVEIVAEITGNYERRLHALFMGDWERGEWFTHTPAMQAVIDAVLDGSFDPETLPGPQNLPNFIPPMHRRRAA